MTELNLAYGFSDEEINIKKEKNNDDLYYKQKSQPQPSQQVIEQQLPSPMMQQPIPMMQQPQPIMMPVVEKYSNRNRNESYSFWDRMIISRGDVIKLTAFSLVILLAISLDKIINNYLTKYLSENIFTNIQEFIIRLAYPIAVFLFLWIIKSL